MNLSNKANNSIITEERLNEWNESLDNIRDRFLIRALFEGICGNRFWELTNITKETLDESDTNPDKSLTISNPTDRNRGKASRKVYISNTLRKLAEEAAEEYEYHTEVGDFPLYDREESSPAVYKCGSQAPEDWSELNRYRQITKALRRIAEKIKEPHLCVEELQLGGQIHYINTQCKELDISAEEFMSSDAYVEKFCRQYKLNKDRFDTSMFICVYKSYLPCEEKAGAGSPRMNTMRYFYV